MDDNLSGKKNYSWWERRTRTEKCLFAFVGLAIIIIIYLTSNLLMLPSSHSLKQEICLSEKCIKSASIIMENIDQKVDPCEDFYKFTCGKFIENTNIPGDKIVISTSSDTVDTVALQLQSLLEENIPQEGPAKLLATFYASCMNTTKIENEGLDYVKKEFKELGGWPVIEPYWNEKHFDWTILLFRLRKLGWRYNFFFEMYVDSDTKNSSRHIFTISQPCMPSDRLKKGLNDSAVRAGYDYMVEIAVLFGADRPMAIVDMRDVIDFEIELAKLVVPYEERSNVIAEYNPMTIRELQRNVSGFSWLKLINNYLAPVDMLNSDDVINLAVPLFMKRLETFLPTVKKRTLANYIFSRLVRDSVSFLTEELRQKQLDYNKIVWGLHEITPRWKSCAWSSSRLNVALSSLYIKHFFNKDLKHKVEELVTDIKFSFLETLRKIAWMDRKTKRHAILKAESMESYVGFPEEILDDKLVEEYYEGLQLDPNESYLKIHFNLSKMRHLKAVQQLRQPIKKPDWRDKAYAYVINAFYSQTDNGIELPAAILQAPFFDPERPQYLNYGALGGIIGHEITHGFDDHGRQFDKDGNAIDWWEPETNQTFAKKSQCLIDQYGNYTIPEIEMNLNGVKTLGENIADNGGIKIAYRGYLRWLEKNPSESALPGLPYTPRQMFWISYASTWCTKYKKQYLKQLVTLGVHSPSYFRVMLPFMNSDHFGRDFNCPIGSPMNPKYKCRVW